MLKMRIGLPDGQRQLILLGLEEENIERLKSGKPILIEPDALGLEHAIAIVYGETKEAIIDELEESGLASGDSAQMMREAAERVNREGGESGG